MTDKAISITPVWNADGGVDGWHVRVGTDDFGSNTAFFADKCGSARQAYLHATQWASKRLRAERAATDMFEALVAAEKHFGPFAEITVNGQHDPDDVRVVATIRAALAKASAA